MINKDTLFILGAGASEPFGYPLAIKLREEICYSSNNRELAQIMAPDKYEEGEYEKLVSEFRKAFLKSGVFSIDAFLEHNVKFMKVGKLAIAQALIPCEKEKPLFNTEKNWYMYLWERMNTNFENFGNNKISFITFNYDRSLEYFLFTALKNKYHNKTEQDYAKKIQAIPIVHLYGQIDFLPWQNDNFVSYGYQGSIIQRLSNAANNIKIVYENEKIADNISFRKAYQLIDKAEQIFFLGFSYDQINLKRIINNSLAGKKVFGTTFKLEKTKVNFTRDYLMARCDKFAILDDKDNLDFLKEYLEIEVS